MTNPEKPVDTATELSTQLDISTDNEKQITELNNDSIPAEPSLLSQEWGVFASTFVTILLAEIGDKTQLTTLLMTAESQNPVIVFIGAGSALILTSLLGVLVGKFLASRLSPKTVETAAGILLILISLTLVWDVIPH
ncbi:MAG: TMEM165/GDT1 family protein [Microcoleaceae cyanobacterium]